MLNLCLCDQNDAFILVSGTINVEESAAGSGKNDIEVLFKKCAPFTDCSKEINNTQVDNTDDIDVVMSMYDLTEYSDNY